MSCSVLRRRHAVPGLLQFRKTPIWNRSNVIASSNFLATWSFKHAIADLSFVGFSGIMRFFFGVGAAAALFVVACCSAVRAEDNAAAWRDIETKYVFGFT